MSKKGIEELRSGNPTRYARLMNLMRDAFKEDNPESKQKPPAKQPKKAPAKQTAKINGFMLLRRQRTSRVRYEPRHKWTCRFVYWSADEKCWGPDDSHSHFSPLTGKWGTTLATIIIQGVNQV